MYNPRCHKCASSLARHGEAYTTLGDISMKSALFLIALCAATPAFAQAPAAVPAFEIQRYGLAPWWMDKPIIASSGFVETEILANRGQFSASFQAVNRNLSEATRLATEKVRPLAQSLAAYGPNRVRVATSFSQRPIYEQYRDKEGNLLNNQRSDKIDSYEVNASISVTLRDVSLAEAVYSSVLAARPTTTQPVYFSLEPTNEAKTELYGKAVADAKRRAELSVQGAGASLGAVKLIDPTGRACQTDVLVAGAPQDGFGGGYAQDVPVPMAPMAMRAAPPPPPPPPGGPALSAEDMRLPLQPPLQKITAQACVIYALR